MLQIDCLARHFASRSIHLDSIFASDLSRARITAEGISRQQRPKRGESRLSPILTSDLREKDFGSLEGVRFSPTSTKTDNGNARRGRAGSASTLTHVESESTASMRRRAISFINAHLLPWIFDDTTQRANVAIVAHGIILRVLWQCLIELFDPTHISIAPGITAADGRPPVLLSPTWSNTAFMSLSIQTAPPLPSDTRNPVSDAHFLLHGWSMRILALDSREHLASLRRTRGGIGSASHDNRQKRIDQFFRT
jgi:broad specificity phosphatase PhoE